MITKALEGNIVEAHQNLYELWKSGYSASDIISTVFKVVKNHEPMDEYIKLEYMKEIGFTHMRIINGLNTLVQLSGLVARLCRLSNKK